MCITLAEPSSPCSAVQPSASPTHQCPSPAVAALTLTQSHGMLFASPWPLAVALIGNQKSVSHLLSDNCESLPLTNDNVNDYNAKNKEERRVCSTTRATVQSI